jgi:expansin (peptidoglycan-binding protein)
MSTRRTKIIRRRVVAGAVVFAAAASAPVAVAATSSSSPRAGVHTQIQRDGTMQVSGYDGGVALQSGSR